MSTHTSCRRPGPQNGERDWDDARRQEDSSEIVGPGEVEVDGPTEEAERDGEKRAEDDAPVLVVEEALLVLFVLLVDRARIMGLHKTIYFGPGNTVQLQIVKN